MKMKRLKKLGVIMGGVTLALTLGVSTHSWAEGQFGLGWQSSGLVRGISAKAVVGSNLCLQGVVGYTLVMMVNPEIEEDGETEKLHSEATLSAMTLRGRGLFKVKSEDNMDVYLGGGVGYFKLSGEVEVDEEKYEGSGGAVEFSGVGGVEYRFQGLPNLAFSTEIGFSYIRLSDIELKYRDEWGEVEKATLKPNTSIKNFFLGVGIHYYF
jgi:hypothetical protein